MLYDLLMEKRNHSKELRRYYGISACLTDISVIVTVCETTW